MTITEQERARQAFIDSIETDVPAFDRDGAFQDSIRLEVEAKKLKLAIEVFASAAKECTYATMNARKVGLGTASGEPLKAIQDASHAVIDAFDGQINQEAMNFLHAIMEAY